MSESQKPVETPAKDCIDDILLLSSLREDARSSLADLLECFRGRKCLFYDKQLSGILAQLSNDMKKFYQEYGVIYFRELGTNLQDFMNECGKDIPENIIFLVRPDLSTMKLIADNIRKLGPRSQFRVCFAPTSTTICLHFLEEMIKDVEIWERISFKDFKIGLIPFDSDLLSFEIDDVFKQCYVDGDLSSLSIISHGLAKLQAQFGVIPNIKSKGVGARKVLQRMMHHRVEEEGNADREQTRQDDLKSEINTLIILDREVDLISPLVTPLTYEGLVDITLGIECGRMRVESVLLGNEEANDLSGTNKASSNLAQNSGSLSNEKITLLLNNNDSVFAEIRNLSIERLGSYMQEKAIHIRERYAAFKGNKDASLAEIHDFVKKIPKLTKDFKSLNQHIHIAELLKKTTDSTEFRDYWQHERAILEGESALDFIEELLYMDAQGTELNQILKLLCLQSLTYGGIRGNRYDSIRRLISQVYGMHHLFTLNNLEKAGLIKRKDAILVVDTSSTWLTLKKQLRLIDEKVNVIKPDDINYVAAGYGPLLVRVVQVMAQATASVTNLPTTFLELLKLLPGPYLDFLQTSTPEELGDQLSKSNTESSLSNNISSQPISSAGNLMTNMVNVANDIGNIAINSRLPIFRKDGADDLANAPAFGGRIKDDAQVNKKIMLVVVVGGLSYLELAAFRFLSSEPSFPFKIIVATTKLMNGSDLLNTLHFKS